VTVTLASALQQNTVGAGLDTLSGFENLMGSAFNDSLTGDGAPNVLAGLAGNDLLNGAAGADSLIGGLGNDTYVVDNAGDVVTEAAAAGTDLVRSAITYTLGVNLENLTLTGAAAINGTGNALANVITGNGANNVLNGGGGADQMSGGLGNDTYIVDNAGDAISEAAAGGTDLVQSSITYTLSAEVENLTLTGAAAINGTGNGLANVLIGNGANNVLNGGGGADQMSGGLGNDTYVVDNAGDGVTEAAAAGTDLVQSAITYTLGANLENLSLTGAAAINGTGNGLANILIGNGANNVLNGGGGADQMSGGLGNDTYLVDNAGDGVTEAAAAGTDVVQASVTHTLSANVENLTLTGAAAINGTGNGLANVLIGNGANNVLNGGGGADQMSGGLGNDTYVVDNAGDGVTEGAGAGTDLVQSSITYTLGANLENLTLTGAAAINGTGNGLANILIGNGANNVLNGGGGADQMSGGLGNDTYVVDNAGDGVTEAAAAGTDLVRSAVSYTLGANLESLTLLGAAAINGTGNALANVITGNASNNVLDGQGGADSLIGGLGNDTYLVDNAGDVLTEAAAGGTDLVQASVTHTLSAEVENLTLTGAAAINGTGNGLANILIGNGANNVLNGGGGADQMSGGLGNDTYVVDNAGDGVTEAAAAGTDLVQSSVTYTLSANVENLSLSGAAAINGTGNALNNVITGNGANNVLNGGGGADQMAGGLGNDVYVVDNAGDGVTEGAAAGTDLVQSAITYTLGTNLENLTLIGAAAINGTGNALNNRIAGNGAGNVLDGAAGADSLIGGLGDDTYLVDNAGDAVTEAAAAGTDLVQAGVTYTLSANVENLTLTGAAAINGTGNALNNVMSGNGADNLLDGGGGADQMSGGLGNDTYVVDDAGDGVTEAAAGGTDLVQSSVTHVLSAEVENLTLTGAGAINGTGNGLANILVGNGADNVLDGGAGADQMSGGLGNDTYVVDNVGDGVTEAAAGGTDLVQSAITYTLGADLENLTLLGAAAINGTGNGLNNTLVGNAGNNLLNGGAGVDALSGGLGNDTYIVDAVGDTVSEALNAGTDVVQSSVSFVLGANVENLVLTGIAAINGTGNGLANTLTGNVANNILNGGGGADTLTGGGGNDTYIVDNAGDLVTEGAAAGTDLVQSAVSYTLGANLENLILIGAAASNGTGNALNNLITGNAANNVLDGADGVDTVSYANATAGVSVDLSQVGPQITGAAGTDTVLNFENLTGSAFADLLAGNGGANTLAGGGGNDVLIGGAGADLLSGAAGSDAFRFDSLAGTDTITDFLSGTDRFEFSQAAIRVGDGDTVIDASASVAGPGGFAVTDELVIVGGNIAGAINAASAAAAIGSASASYALGATALFAVDNGAATGVFLFTSAGADALVSAAELTQIASAGTAASTTAADYLFVA
jgi:Ca2+-binding RTX toxin-like protein